MAEEKETELTPKEEEEATPREAVVQDGDAPQEATSQEVVEEATSEEEKIVVAEEALADETGVVETTQSVTQVSEGTASIDEIEAELSKIKEVDTSGADDLDKVEEERQKLTAYYKKQNRWSILVIILVLVFVIGGFVLVIMGTGSEDEGANWALEIPGFVLIVLAIVGVILQYIIGRRKVPKAVETYAAMAIDIFNTYNFSNHEYSKVMYDETEKIVASDVLADRVYYDVMDTKSQAVVRGTYAGAVFRIGNLAVMVKGENKKQNDTAFLGRYITYPNTLKMSDRIILNFKGAKPIDMPTDIFDLVKTEVSENFDVYAPEGVDYTKVIPHKFLEAVSKIEVVDSLLNLNISIWQGHTAVYLTYVDAYVSIPYNDPLNREYYEKGKADIHKVLSALKIINK
ncbi:MAG: hypothetical protein LUC31_01430 [Coprobacillus sp.]|nr:hypothetical protein [Coprobacillus sp.]